MEKNKTITKTRKIENTKIFKVFFMISYFRVFVIKDLVL